MLMNDTLIDKQAVWNLRPEWIPGKVITGPSAAVHKIKVSIALRYPNGQEFDKIYLTKDADGFTQLSLTDKILFTTKLAPKSERSTPDSSGMIQPDKVIVDVVRKVSNSEHSNAITEYERVRSSKITEVIQELENIYNARIQKLESDIEEQATRQSNDKLQAAHKELDNKWEEYTANRNSLKIAFSALAIEQAYWDKERQQLQNARKELEQDKHEFEQAGGIELLELIRQTREANTNDEQIPEKIADEQKQVPPNVVKQLKSQLQRQSYSVDDALLLQTLLCLCVGAATGQFIVLTGPPGSGKTSLVGKIAQAVGAGSGVVPVRPAWIDATDLIGFYNPNVNRYQPTPFLEYVLQAKKYSDYNRLYCLVLDEMNLGRVENYAADFLSLLEKSREGAQDAELPLYSREIKNRLRADIRRNPATDMNRSDIKQQTAELLYHMEAYPDRLPFPEGLVLFGTINVDETTHLPSPKFLDRALTIQVSGTKLPEALGKQVRLDGVASEASFSWALSLATTKRGLEAGTDLSSKDQETWRLLMKWNEQYFKPLGIRLSHRLPLSSHSE